MMDKVYVREVHFHESPSPKGGITEGELLILRSNRRLFKEVMKMAQEIDDLKREVSEAKSVMASASTLIRGIHGQVEAAVAAALAANPGVDLSELSTLASDLDTGANDLAAAVTENTPVAENPTAETPAEIPGTPAAEGSSDTANAGTTGAGGAITVTATPDAGGTENPSIPLNPV